MPRYKLSPIERAAEKERKENLRNIMKGFESSIYYHFGAKFEVYTK